MPLYHSRPFFPYLNHTPLAVQALPRAPAISLIIILRQLGAKQPPAVDLLSEFNRKIPRIFISLPQLDQTCVNAHRTAGSVNSLL